MLNRRRKSGRSRQLWPQGSISLSVAFMSVTKINPKSLNPKPKLLLILVFASFTEGHSTLSRNPCSCGEFDHEAGPSAPAFLGFIVPLS